MSAIDFLALFGGLLGFAAFLWRSIEAVMSYLTLKIEPNERVSTGLRQVVRLSVENRGTTPRRIDYAALLVLPAESNIEQFSALLASENPTNFDYASALFNQRPLEPLYNSDIGIAAIPIPFLYSEQLQVGNEIVTCSVLIDGALLRHTGLFEVRFVVLVRHFLGILRHRVVADIISFEEGEQKCLASRA